MSKWRRLKCGRCAGFCCAGATVTPRAEARGERLGVAQPPLADFDELGRSVFDSR